MTRQGAQRAIIVSALIVFIVYFYRHLTEGTTGKNGGVGQLIGFGTPANLGRFITAWGFVFFTLSIISEAAPGLGGSFAILVAVGDILTNGTQVAKDINKKVSNQQGNAGPSVSPGVSHSNLPNSKQTTAIVKGTH